ncbi:telomere-associated protein RIF1 [Vanessa cardui]|uniref:telomere-associated protein RIF1 n=1 Tax=Vanessa cardui TaxID=171605 RepID=UPI001F14536C|nr:telomere-associated protein RIF1 [Vanessa cardui]
MPEEESSGTDLERLLDHLDDYTLNVHNYQSIQNALEAENSIEIPVLEKLLSICARDLKDDMKNSVNMLNILATTLKKIKTMQSLPDLVPSAIAVLNILKTTALFNKVEALKTLCFEIIMSYPDETLICISVNHSSEIMELLNLYCHQRIPLEIRLQPINIIIKLLKILPPEKRTAFVKEGISIWFSKIVPTIVSVTSSTPHVLEALELLTDELVHIDYADNPQWRVVLECIYTPQKYPALMKNLLEIDNDDWHRLWIVFIKLLKNQITKSTNTVGSPINSMLPVVEMAFKMDVTNRCRAFSCWNVLIDNFSTETNEVYINKRIKLLIIPLTSNNAKVEETAIAKLKTWWHLMSRFYTRMDKFSDMILIPFLHFCFGKPVASDKPMIIPGMISEATKVQVVQAFINIIGHADCDGCVALPKLKGKLISTKLLVSHWKDWIHALNIVIPFCAESNEFTEQHIKCFWKSFIMTIGELAENNIRRDVFNEVLGLMKKLTVGCHDSLAEIILNNLILILFDKDDKIKPLLKSKDEQNAPIHKIITIILKLPLSNLENRHLVVQNFKVLCRFLVEEAFKTSSHTIECILKYLPPNGFLLWIALADTMSELLYTSCPRMLCRMLLWPFQIMDIFVNEQLATTAWLKMYKCVYPSLNMTNINEDIIKTLEVYNSDKSSTMTILNVAILMLNQKIQAGDDSDFIKEAEFLLKIMGKLELSNITSIFASLAEVIVLMLKKLCQNTNIKAAKSAISIIAIILKMCPQTSNDCVNEEDYLNQLDSIFNSLESVLKEETYSKLKSILVDPLKNCASYFKNRQVLRSHVLTIFKNVASNDENIEITVKDLIKVFEEDENIPNQDTENGLLKQSVDKINFTTPSSKTIAKKQKKKEVNSVNTVTENGEEYIVVKSSWKFNPRKLTDNQKEKFQRKREDIPALYQDLSQSQDEFKLTTWKTDSQDTTTTTSKSTSEQGKEDVSSILKNMPSSEFVPKILENIMGKDKVENDQKGTLTKENSPSDTGTDINKQEVKKDETNKQQLTVRDTKSPRLALKDRVFRNVRNLIEKSNLSKEANEVNSILPENGSKTPVMKAKPPANLTNSAPTLICVDRPSRVKRKPKKFDDLEAFSLKKRRHSSGQNDSPSDSELIESNTPPTNILNDPTKEPEIPKVDEKESTEINDKKLQINLKEANASDKEINTEETLNQTNISICEDKNDANDKTSESDNKQNEEAQEEKAVDISNEKLMESPGDVDKDKNSQINTPSADKNKLPDVQKSSKKSVTKKSRIEKELAIDMVEGHPFLKVQSEKRLTRKAISNSPRTRKSLSEKCTKKKLEMKTPKADKKTKDKERSISIKETQNTNTEDTMASQDVIESSQDSTITTISVKSCKSIGKKVVDASLNSTKCDNETETQNLLEDSPNIGFSAHAESKDDIELPLNKTVDEKSLIDLTENMDTEPINVDDEVIIINDDDDQSIPVSIEDKSVEQNTQNTALAETQSLDPSIFINEEENNVPKVNIVNDKEAALKESSAENVIDNDVTNASLNATSSEETKTMTDSVLATIEKEDSNAQLKDEEQRKQDFFNNTLEISPIKTLSPVRDKKSPSPETSSDYVVIKLSSPVQSNGEPFDKMESPEFFTEEKISPDKRDQSPPREEVSVTNTSPSSSLSLKKNRPQVRSGGRAAQMLGLCVPDRLQTIMMSEKSLDGEEIKKSPSLNTSARRNLRILYNSSTGETNDNSDEQEDSENFLKFKRNLPSTDCSPSGPILKRKLIDITDETTASPASKRKRVSFHDPPVSTTICVKKYIEPGGVRSPQNSAIKRQERQLRSQLATKSPKRLENVFKLDSVLTKAVESFTEPNVIVNTNEDSEMSSIEQTPIVQVIKTTDLNDTDPICSKLIDCKDPISNIASELSSPAMKVLLIKEFEGKINTVGDLAKLTELEINRLCIKAPKVQVAEKVLNDYLKKIIQAEEEMSPTIEAAMNESSIVEDKLPIVMQTNDVVVENIGMQTDVLDLSSDSTQTDSILTNHSSSQTDESGNKTTAEIVTTCLSERTDFITNLCEKMDEASKKKIVDNLSYNALTEVLMKKMTKSNSDVLLNKVIEQKSTLEPSNKNNTDRRLSIVQDYLCERFDYKDLILFCSDLLKKVYEKP